MAIILELKQKLNESIDVTSSANIEVLNTVVNQLDNVNSIMTFVVLKNGDKLMYHSSPTITEKSVFQSMLQFNIMQDMISDDDLEDDV